MYCREVSNRLLLASVLLLLLLYLLEHFGNGHQFQIFGFLFLLPQCHQLFVFILSLRDITLIWFLVFFGKKLLRIWKSVPYFLRLICNSSTYSSVQFLDFSLSSESMVWLLGLLEIDSVSLSAFFFLGFYNRLCITVNSMESIKDVSVSFCLSC